MKPWGKENEDGQLPGDICCQRAGGGVCYEHDPSSYPEWFKSKNLHMVIVIKEGIEPQYAAVGAAHAALAGYLKWEDDPLVIKWAHGIFNKHLKKATPEQFEKAKGEKYGDKIVITESNLGGEEVAIVYRVQKKYPAFLNTLPKWSAKVCRCEI
jgi:hypothetical protein